MLVRHARWFWILIFALITVTAFTGTGFMKARTQNQKTETVLPLSLNAQMDSRLRNPRELRLQRARPFDGDLRKLPYRKPVKKWRPEREPPDHKPRVFPGTSTSPTAPTQPGVSAPAAPAPTPNISFDGLDKANFGAGHPPDENGDVGPTYYIQVINTSIGIFNKSTGVRVAAFTFDTFMSQGNFGNLCDTDNFGDPVVLYDSFEDRWFISDFAFQLDDAFNVIIPPCSFRWMIV